MDIVNLLSGGGDSSADIQTTKENIAVNLREEELVKNLKGSFSEKSSKQIAPKTSKGMWKQVNNTVNKILNIVNNNTNPPNSELIEKINSISKEVINNKVTVTELKESLVKTPQQKLRDEDDNEEKAKKILKESLTEVVTNSETIASIEKSLVKLDTKVGVNTTTTNNSSGVIGDLLTMVSAIPGPIGKIGKIASGIYDFVSQIPQIYLLLGPLKEGIDKALDFFKPAIDSVKSTVENVLPDSVKNFFSSDEKSSSVMDNLTGAASKGVNFVKGLFGSDADNIVKPEIDVKEAELAKTGEKLIDKEAVKVAEKSIFKTLVKKIPFIGALMGAGFAVPRALEGDYEGAAMEVASGLASSFPGVGTAASVGIDTALFARDMKHDTDITPLDIDVNSEKTKKVIDSVKPVNIYNDNNTTINNSSSNTQNMTMEPNEKDFIFASKF